MQKERNTTYTAIVEDSSQQQESEFHCGLNRQHKGGKNLAYRKWRREQNQLYARYLEDNFNEFYPEEKRVSMYTFNKMSQTINLNKNNRQCRSHHQKMMKKFGSISNIIHNILLSDACFNQKGPCDSSAKTRASSTGKNDDGKDKKPEIQLLDLLEIESYAHNESKEGIWFEELAQTHILF